MSQTPLLILSDAPTSSTGLGRITRELAIRIHENLSDVFRVGTAGIGGTYSRELPWRDQYALAVDGNMVATNLATVWNNFAGDEHGVILCIWNPGWLGWLANPDLLPGGTLRDFLHDKPFKKWLYAPIDGDGPHGTIVSISEVLHRFDRVLAYTKYGADVIDKTLDVRYTRTMSSTPYLPHGLDSSVFYPRDFSEARRTFVKRVLGVQSTPMREEVLLVGICATNTARKNWPLGLEVCGELLNRGVNVGLWAHTDVFRKNWDIPTLAEEFGMERRTILSNKFMSDEDMAWAYSACDVTLAIGSGEGWGLPITESLACGIPCVHGNYAGGAELTPKNGLIDPVGFHGDGFFGIRRPVYRATDWADAVQKFGHRGGVSLLDRSIEWDNCWPKWAEWLKEGLK